MEKYDLGNGSFILHGKTTEDMVKSISAEKLTADLIVVDPDYRDIGRLLKTEMYKHLRDILGERRLLLHYTHNAAGATNCRMSLPHNLIQGLSEHKLRYVNLLPWAKYSGQKLINKKMSWLKSATPSDTDMLILCSKNAISVPNYVDLEKLHKKQGILYHQADQRSQFKPAGLCKDIIASLTKSKSLVIDTHMGGGNLAIESLIAGRRYIGLETDKTLVKQCLKRIEQLKIAA